MELAGASLQEEGVLRLQLDDSSSQAGIFQKCGSVKPRLFRLSHLNGPFPEVVILEGNPNECATASDLE
jgi:hypothetical protein